MHMYPFVKVDDEEPKSERNGIHSVILKNLGLSAFPPISEYSCTLYKVFLNPASRISTNAKLLWHLSKVIQYKEGYIHALQ